MKLTLNSIEPNGVIHVTVEGQITTIDIEAVNPLEG